VASELLIEVMRRLRILIPLLSLLTILAGLQASSAAASSTQDAIFQDDAQLFSNPAGTLQTFRELGVSRVRVGVYWNRIAPQASSRHRPKGFNAADPGAYPGANWGIYDSIVNQARADGIALDLTVTGPAPLWATGSGMPHGGPYAQWKPSAREFGSFVRAVAARYSGSYRPRGTAAALPRVSFWSIWNEPNYGIDLAPQATNHDTIEVGAAAYRGLVDAAWGALQATHHGRDTILFGETAPRGKNHPIGNFSGVKPLRFLRALYCVDSSYRQLRGSAASARGCPTTGSGSRSFRKGHPGLFNATAFADHPYAQGFTPTTPTYACGRQVCGNGHRSDPDYTDFPEIPRLERALDRLQGVYGSHNHLPIWSTEYGYWTKPPSSSATISPATAAYYSNWAEYLSWRQSRVRSFMQYLLVDPPANNFASGLEFKTGAHKATFDAYRLPLYLPATSGKRGRALEVWGCVRPAHYAALDTGATQRVAIQFRSGSSGPFRTVKTVAITSSRGYFDVRQAFTGSGSVRLAWADPAGGTTFSRTVAIKLR
jgi:hypothetical protein